MFSTDTKIKRNTQYTAYGFYIPDAVKVVSAHLAEIIPPARAPGSEVRGCSNHQRHSDPRKETTL